MLLLLFRSMEELFAIEAKHVVEVIPRVELRAVPHAPAALEGLLNYRGRVVPVIDFSTLLGSNRSRDALSTRMIIVQFHPTKQRKHSIGLIAESVINVREVSLDQRRMRSTSLDTAPYLGAVYEIDGGLVQVVTTARLLDDKLGRSLFDDEEETEAS